MSDSSSLSSPPRPESGPAPNGGTGFSTADPGKGRGPAEGGSSAAARWLLGSVGAFLVGLGIFFAWWLWHAGERAMITRHWREVPCTIIVSGLKESRYSPNDPLKWQPDLEYRYVVDGQHWMGTRLHRIEGPTPHQDKVRSALAEYPPGKETVCYLNPADPAEAVLKHSTKAPFYTLWWPLLFSVGGAGILAGALRGQARS